MSVDWEWDYFEHSESSAKRISVPIWAFSAPVDAELKACLMALWTSESDLVLCECGASHCSLASWGDLCRLFNTTHGVVARWTSELAAMGWIRKCAIEHGWNLALRAPFSRPKTPVPGYVYALEFSDGRVKVGRTGDPVKRVRHHVAEARRSRLEATACWTSPYLADMVYAETWMIDVASRLGDLVPHTQEYFTGFSFNSLVVRAHHGLVDRVFAGGGA